MSPADREIDFSRWSTQRTPSADDISLSQFVERVLSDDEVMMSMPELREARDRRALVLYVALVYGSCAPLYSNIYPPIPDWYECAKPIIQFSILVAYEDCTIFDAVLDVDDDKERTRVRLSARYLEDCVYARTPDVSTGIQRWDMVKKIGEGYRALTDRHAATTHPDVLELWQTRASAVGNDMSRDREPPRERFSREVIENLKTGELDTDTAFRRIINHYGSRLPQAVQKKIHALLQAASPQGRDELHVLLHMADMIGTIGGHAYIVTAALHGRSREVTPRALAALKDLDISDFLTRLNNDLADLSNVGLTGSDPGETVCAIFMSDEQKQNIRNLSVDQADQIRQNLAGLHSWLWHTTAESIRNLWKEWPWLGGHAARAAYITNRVYQDSHFKTLSSAQMEGIFQELDGPGKDDFLYLCNPNNQ